MKKITLLVIFSTFWMIPVVTTAQKTSSVKLGLRVAPAIGWINPNASDYESEGMRAGISAGLVSDFYFTDHYAISTGFSFLFPSGKLSYPARYDVDDIPMSGSLTRQCNFTYLEIPFMVKMKTNSFGMMSFFGQIGFGTGFRLKATAKDHFTPDLTPGQSVSEEQDINSSTTLMRESVLAGVGVEYKLDASTRLFGGFNYSNSLNDLFTGTNQLSGEKEKGVLNFLELNIGILF